MIGVNSRILRMAISFVFSLLIFKIMSDFVANYAAKSAIKDGIVCVQLYK